MKNELLKIRPKIVLVPFIPGVIRRHRAGASQNRKADGSGTKNSMELSVTHREMSWDRNSVTTHRYL